MQDTGFWADTSGRTKYTFGTRAISGFWDLKADTQPYYPSQFDQNRAQPPQLTILEIPNNGADDYAYSAAQMIDRFWTNYDQTPLLKPRQITYLSHPQWFDGRRQQTMAQVFTLINQHRLRDGLGPVVMTSLSQVYQAFK